MLDFIRTNWETIIILAVAIAGALLVVCLIQKLFRLAIGVFILGILVPILFTIFWGDGYEYVEQFSSIFTDKYSTQITTAYDYYKKKDAEDPFIDYDAVSNTVTMVFDEFKDKVSEELEKK